MIVIDRKDTEVRERSDAFCRHAEKVVAGEVLVSPILLPKEERRLYVRQTLLEDNQRRIQNVPDGAQEKFTKLTKSPFTFFRGTALLFYRDYAGMDADLPVVFAVGDVHPENFGVMPNENGVPFFGVNDFDEASFAPFTYDLKRGAVGFYLVAKEGGIKKSKRDAIVRAWVEGYLEGLHTFTRDDRERWFQVRLDTAPPMIRKLLEQARRDRKTFLARMVDLEKERFIPTDEVVPLSREVGAFQEAIDRYRSGLDLKGEEKADSFMRVRDVAVKKASGTASLGLLRYYVLIGGPTDDPTDDIILELKQARTSALLGLTGIRRDQADRENGDETAAEDIVRAQKVHAAGGDPYYGRTTIEGRSYVVREHSPFKEEVDVDELNARDLETYARICGEVLAQTHARSDEHGEDEELAGEHQILAAVNPPVFVDDLLRFARTAAKRIYRDYKGFKRDLELGVFDVFRTEHE